MVRRTAAASIVLIGAISAGGVLIATGAQPQRSDAQGRSLPPPADSRTGQPAAGPDLGQRLIQGLEATEGCLGTNATGWPDGRRSIFAWFENKAAVERWYYSDTHRFMMGQVGAPGEERKPMEHVQDPDAPVMVIATINFNGTPAVPGPIPFSEIAIELFTPLPGGAYIGRRLAPEAFAVPHMRNFTEAGYPPKPGAED